MNELENESEWSFNFDAERLSDYYYTGKVELSQPLAFLEQLLKETPFTFEIDEQHILISLPPKKTYTICGYIKRAADSSEVPHANILAEGLNVGTASDQRGYFELTVEAYKNQNIIISHLGLVSVSRMVQDWLPDCMTFRLVENLNLLDSDLIISGYLLKGIDEGLRYGSIGMDFRALEDEYSFQEYDVLKTVQLLPGITSVNESATDLNIRGSTADHNLVRWEGATLYNPGHFFGLISSINPFVVDRLDVYKSVFDPKYENRIGGVVDISLGNTVTDSLNGGFGTTLTESHAFLNLPLVNKKLSALLSGRLTTNHFFESPTLKNYADKIFQTEIIGEESSTGTIGLTDDRKTLNFYDWNAKIVYQFSKKLLLEGSYFQSKNSLEFSSNVAGADFISNQSDLFETQAVSTKLSMDWSSKLSSQLFINQSLYERESQSLFSNNPENQASFEIFTFNDIDDIQIGVTNQWNLNQHIKLELGYSYKKLTVDYIIDQSSIIGDYDGSKRDNGQFQNIISSFSFQNDKFTLMTGLRSTYYKDRKDWYFSPRVNLQYLIKPELKVKLAYGKFFQFISQLVDVNNAILSNSDKFWVLSSGESGNILNSRKISGGLVYNRNGWLVDLETYYFKTNGISTLSTSLAPDISIETVGESKVKGVDFLLKKNWAPYSVWLNYTLSKNDYLFPKIDSTAFPANIDQRHNLSIVQQMVTGKWNYSLTYQLRTGLPYSIPAGVEPIDSEDMQNTFYRLVFDKINNNTLDYYGRLDLGVTYRTLVLKGKFRVELGFSLLNLLNRKNIYSRDNLVGDPEGSEGPKILTINQFHLKRTPQILFRVKW